jgi:hypothetical protein
MGLAGRKYLEEHFSRSVIAEKLVRVMEDLVGSTGLENSHGND